MDGGEGPYDDFGSCRRSAKAARPWNDIRSEIWRLFGKDRDRYMRNDAYSDEDDVMEVDADALRREGTFSSYCRSVYMEF